MNSDGLQALGANMHVQATAHGWAVRVHRQRVLHVLHHCERDERRPGLRRPKPIEEERVYVFIVTSRYLMGITDG